MKSSSENLGAGELLCSPAMGWLRCIGHLIITRHPFFCPRLVEPCGHIDGIGFRCRQIVPRVSVRMCGVRMWLTPGMRLSCAWHFCARLDCGRPCHDSDLHFRLYLTHRWSIRTETKGIGSRVYTLPI